jgi:iron(III) transport system ATP-binding protein
MQEIIAELKEVSKTYETLTAVDSINLKIRKGEFTALLGPSGCGKSTILRILAGFEEVNQGTVTLNGQAVSGKDHCPPEKRGIGMVFQDLALFPHLNVADNICFGYKSNRTEKQQRASELLDLVGLKDMGHKMPHMLSGGQQQRVAVARALAPRPDLLLMDEPFSSLDFQLRLQMRKELWEILKNEGVTVVLVTHDCREAFDFADRVILMKQGRVVQEGSPVEVYHHPRNPWAAKFVGGANFISAEADQSSILSELGCFQNENGCQSGSCFQMVRPENISIQKAEPDQCSGHIQNINFLGDREVLTIRLKSGKNIKAYVESGQNWSLFDSVAVHPKQFQLFSTHETLN